MANAELELEIHLMDDSIPGISSIIDNDVDFAISKIRCFLDKCLEVCGVEHIARYIYCRTTGFIDLARYVCSFSCGDVSVIRNIILDGRDANITGINIRNHDFRTLIREQSRCLRTNALPGASDNGYLAIEHALWIV